MELAPAGVNLTFEVTYDSDSLSVGMSVYDTTGGGGSLVQGPDLMANLVGNTYTGQFTPDAGHTYVIFKAVYTDDSLDTLDDNYSQGSESIAGQDIGGGSGGGGQSIIGIVADDDPVVGYVEC